MRGDKLTEIINVKEPRGKNKLGKSYRVLMVDDSSTVRKLGAQMLRSEMFEICGEASDGYQAFQVYKELKPDVVTMDVNMPVMNGIEALRQILAYDKNAKVVMVTSEGHRDMVMEAVKLGAKGYVVKPFRKDPFCEQLKLAIDS
ncbi:MAG: response regulator [Spirochaetaceae bacterium]|nr:response regulator [Spirochaetaceae bacterium]